MPSIVDVSYCFLQDELDQLNAATDEINKLEKELDVCSPLTFIAFIALFILIFVFFVFNSSRPSACLA